MEIIYAAIACVAVLLLITLVRRAARKNLQGGGARPQLDAGEDRAARRRARADAEAEPGEAERDRAKIRVKDRKRKASSEAERKAAEQREQRARAEARDRDEELAREEAAAEAKAEAEAEQAEVETEAERERKLKDGLAKTRKGFVARIGKLFAKKSIDENVLDELEEVLFTADIGPKTADKLFSAVKSNLSRAELSDANKIWTELKKASLGILDIDADPIDFERARPFVLVVIGVNGVGKTTTIGKLAAKLTREGKKVLLAAGDTFRAAAVEQLEVWGERSGCPVVKGKSGADPSSVIFDGIKRAQNEGYDVIIADTAGRLHTKVDLMDELAKVGRVIGKAMDGAPHDVFLVLDSTTGQNAIQQAEIFKNAMDISGIVLTKLDGTAKGGVILGIADEMNVPVRFIGIGEQVDDLRPFEAAPFVDALYGQDADSATDEAASG